MGVKERGSTSQGSQGPPKGLIVIFCAKDSAKHSFQSPGPSFFLNCV